MRCECIFIYFGPLVKLWNTPFNWSTYIFRRPIQLSKWSRTAYTQKTTYPSAEWKCERTKKRWSSCIYYDAVEIALKEYSFSRLFFFCVQKYSLWRARCTACVFAQRSHKLLRVYYFVANSKRAFCVFFRTWSIIWAKICREKIW